MKRTGQPNQPRTGLAECLTQQLLRRERFALAAAEASGPDWYPTSFDGVFTEPGGELVAVGSAGQMAGAVACHIAYNDPAIVLFDLEIWRRIVELHTGQHECPGASDTEPCETLRVLGLPLAGNPHYPQEWRPRSAVGSAAWRHRGLASGAS